MSTAPRSLGTKSRAPHPVYSAFTLIEVVISSALMAMIIVAAYLCFSASVAGQKTMEPRLEVIQNARVAMALMTADLRAACPLDKDSEFLGMHRTMGDMVADNLDFATHNYTPGNPREGDFCEISYYLDKDKETGQFSLWRRRNPTIAPDPLSGGSKEEIATDVHGLQLEYFDGLDWYDSWGDVEGRGKAQNSQKDHPNLSGMPEAVRITLWFDSNPHKQTDATAGDQKPEPPMVFQTVARLNLASSSDSSSAGGSSTTSSDTSGQTPEAVPGGGMN
jgi:type II secretory pathway component PulJ